MDENPNTTNLLVYPRKEVFGAEKGGGFNFFLFLHYPLVLIQSSLTAATGYLVPPEWHSASTNWPIEGILGSKGCNWSLA